MPARLKFKYQHALSIFNADKLEGLIDELNLTHNDWHFYLKDCRIKGTKEIEKNINLKEINNGSVYK